MLTVLAHAGHTVTPTNLWDEWHIDPLVAVLLVVGIVAYFRWEPDSRRRSAFSAGIALVAAALISPLDAISESLASVHMVQHMLLTLLAAPLIAWSRPLEAMLRSSPRSARKIVGRWRRQTGLTPARTDLLRHPVLAFAAHAGTLWFWHAALFYEAALTHLPIHALQHVTFLFTAVWMWSTVLGGMWSPRVSLGTGILALFGTSLQGVLLSAMLTFAVSPWYEPYRSTAPLWGLDPLSDQQLAGLIMWIPAGLVYIAAALGLLMRWMGDSEQEVVSGRW